MAEFPNFEEMTKNVAEQALDNFLYDGKSIREWMQIIASEDAISRQAVLDINESHHGQMPNNINHRIWEEIKELPPVQPQAKTGHWIDNKARKDLCNCSECGALSKAYSKYCPNCGAKMVESRKRG